MLATQDDNESMAFEENKEGVRESSCEKKDFVGIMRKEEAMRREERKKKVKGKEQPERLTKIEMTLP